MSPRASHCLIRDEQFSNDPKAVSDIRVTHFGLVSDQGEFLSTRCRAYNYNRHSHMKMAYTFGSRRSTNITSPKSRSLGLSQTAANWVNSSIANKTGD